MIPSKIDDNNSIWVHVGLRPL